MFAGFAGLTAIGVSFCDVWSALTSTTGDTLIFTAPPAATVALATVAQSAAASTKDRRFIEPPELWTAAAGTIRDARSACHEVGTEPQQTRHGRPGTFVRWTSSI